VTFALVSTRGPRRCGGKALDQAIRAMIGADALTQRCRWRKERNILDHLPEVERGLIARMLRAAWVNLDADQPRSSWRLAGSLAKKRPGAAASLREGLDQTLTVTRLGISGWLLRTVESTNPVESMIEIVRDHSRRVKNWKARSDGKKAVTFQVHRSLTTLIPASWRWL
jgi:putative transposase